MRRLPLLTTLLLALLVPGTVQAGGCPPGVDAGVVDKEVYRLGEIVDFFDSYHDFADPGTVTITFERTTDGATREFTAFNGPDGTWYLTVTFDTTADVGRWNVTVVVDQTGALDTCTDVLTIRTRSGLPNTSTSTPIEPAGTGDLGALGLALAVGGSVSWAAAARRRAVASHEDD